MILADAPFAEIALALFERDRLFAENAELRERLAQAQHTHSIQTAMIRKLMAANNTRKSK